MHKFIIIKIKEKLFNIIYNKIEIKKGCLIKFMKILLEMSLFHLFHLIKMIKIRI